MCKLLISELDRISAMHSFDEKVEVYQHISWLNFSPFPICVGRDEVMFKELVIESILMLTGV